jgi:hypothetical protein
MRPFEVTVTSSNSPKVIPMNYRGGKVGVILSPNSATYTVAFTNSDIQRDGSPIWYDDPDATSITTAYQSTYEPITALRITLNSGTSVNAEMSQSDS